MITNVRKNGGGLRRPYILITDKKISSLQEILPVMEKVARQGKKNW